ALAHRLTRRLAECRRSGMPFLRPDGKSQVSVEYRNGRPYKVRAVVIAAQHEDGVSTEQLRESVNSEVIDKVVPPELRAPDMKRWVNATGRFVIGGPQGDSGVTGRKIIVDTYGGMGHHGGGAFSGKDPTKVDRSACYAARHAAKNVVAAGLADRCEIQLSYAIGVAKPLSVFVETFGTGTVSPEKLTKIVEENFDFTPRGLIEYYN